MQLQAMRRSSTPNTSTSVGPLLAACSGAPTRPATAAGDCAATSAAPNHQQQAAMPAASHNVPSDPGGCSSSTAGSKFSSCIQRSSIPSLQLGRKMPATSGEASTAGTAAVAPAAAGGVRPEFTRLVNTPVRAASVTAGAMASSSCPGSARTSVDNDSATPRRTVAAATAAHPAAPRGVNPAALAALRRHSTTGSPAKAQAAVAAEAVAAAAAATSASPQTKRRPWSSAGAAAAVPLSQVLLVSPRVGPAAAGPAG